LKATTIKLYNKQPVVAYNYILHSKFLDFPFKLDCRCLGSEARRL